MHSMIMQDREYLEERSHTLRELGPGSLYDTRTRAEINASVERLRELVELGSDLLELMSHASGNRDVERMRRWLERDLKRQRELLKDFNEQGFNGAVDVSH